MTTRRELVVPVYLPWLGLSITLGMLSVALPLALTSVEMGYGAIAAVLAANGVGSALTAVPIGARTARVGERAVMVAGLVGVVISTAALALSDRPMVLAALQFAAGSAAVGIRIGAQTLITHTVAPTRRGRAMSVLGGMRRLGMFVGPLLAGAAIEVAGYAWTFVAAGVVSAVGLPALMGARSVRLADATATVRPQPLSLRQALARHWRRLLVVSSGPVLIMTVRRGRALVLPLIADDLGVDPLVVGVVVSIGTGADLLLFPVAGWIMDTFGRLRAIIPAFGLMALGLILLGLARGTTEVVIAGVVIGLGNGLSAGSMLTLGSDLAPSDSPSQFMAAFAALQDWGIVFGPLSVGLLAGAVGLGGASVVLGLLLVAGLGLIVATAGETRRREPVL